MTRNYFRLFFQDLITFVFINLFNTYFKKIVSAEATDINEEEQSLLQGEDVQVEEEGIISPQVKEESTGW